MAYSITSPGTVTVQQGGGSGLSTGYYAGIKRSDGEFNGMMTDGRIPDVSVSNSGYGWLSAKIDGSDSTARPIKISALANGGTSKKTAEVYLKYNGISAGYITVEQEGITYPQCPTFSIPDSYNFNVASTGSFDITINSLGGVTTADQLKSYLVVQKLDGQGITYTLSYSTNKVTVNLTHAELVATSWLKLLVLTVYCEGPSNKTITIDLNVGRFVVNFSNNPISLGQGIEVYLKYNSGVLTIAVLSAPSSSLTQSHYIYGSIVGTTCGTVTVEAWIKGSNINITERKLLSLTVNVCQTSDAVINVSL